MTFGLKLVLELINETFCQNMLIPRGSQTSSISSSARKSKHFVALIVPLILGDPGP